MKLPLVLAVVLLGAASCRAQTAPRIAVSDPQINTFARFRMDTAEMNAVAGLLNESG